MEERREKEERKIEIIQKMLFLIQFNKKSEFFASALSTCVPASAFATC